MIKCAEKHGYSVNSKSRQINNKDLQEFDLSITMDMDNYHEVKALMNESLYPKLYLLSDFSGMEGLVNVPDPYYEGAEAFNEVFNLLENLCCQLMEVLEKKGDVIKEDTCSK